MRMKFIGAAGGSVTGSCTHFHYPRTEIKFLVDCGLVQGEGDFESINKAPFPFDPGEIQFVLLTHAHLDHCGLLPKLVRHGFEGKVICSSATARLARISLLDSTNYPGSLFTRDEVDRIQFDPIDDNPARAQAGMFPVRKDLFVGFRRTAHILGSCSVTIGWLDEQDQRRFLVMSGDLGNNVRDNLYQPLLAHRRGIFAYPDAIVVESTYGNRPRGSQFKSFDGRIDALRQLLQAEVFDRQSLLVIPAFALQRTQEVLLDLVIVLQRHFASEAASSSPYLVPSRFWDDFNGDSWAKPAQQAIDRALAALPIDERTGWLDAIESTGNNHHPFQLKKGCGRSIEALRALVEEARAVYPIDIFVDSKLARSMGAVIRDELQRRAAHKPEEPAYRNPELMGRLGLESEEALANMLAALLPDPRTEQPPFRIGPHTIYFGDLEEAPSRLACTTRGAILLTGGGMCEGGPVVGHLQKLATQKRECVLVQTGFMAASSLGARLAEIARDQRQGATKPGKTINIGQKIDIPAEEIRLRTVDISSYYSGHADQDGLVDFVFAADGRLNGDAAPPATRVFINHGNPAARQALKQAIEARCLELRTGDRVVGAVELPETGSQAFDFLQSEWITVEESRTTEQLLEALLKEQMKTNDLLRQLLRAGAETGAKRKFAPGKPKKPSAT